MDYFLLLVCSLNLLFIYLSNKKSEQKLSDIENKLERIDKIESVLAQQKANDDIQNNLNKRLLDLQNKRYSPENRTMFRARRTETLNNNSEENNGS